MRTWRTYAGLWGVFTGFAGILIAVSLFSATALFGAPSLQAEGSAKIVALSGTDYVCPRTVGCNITATKGALVYAGGEARTSATGTADLQSRTAVYRIQNSGTLRFQNVTDAITLVTLWFGRLFVAHDPQGRDVVTVNAGGTRVVAVDTLFTMVVTGTANLGDGDVYLAVAAGGGSVQVTLASGATGELLHGQQLTIPAGAQALPPPQLISPVEQAGFDAVITAWRQTPGLVLPTSPEFVPQTGYRVADKFLPYWTSHDGPRLLGYPVSEEFYAPSILDQGASAGLQAFQATPGPHLYASQCFERALMEFHPENAGSPYIVEGAQLGRFSYRARYGDAGAAGQVPNQTPDDSHYFPETGHWVGGRFWHFWQEHGGLAQHGYPLSDEFSETSLLDGTPYTVQYFERSVFEYHPEFAGSDFEVSLTQLGTYYCRGGALPTLTPTATETPTLTPTATSTPVPTATETPTDTPTPGPGGHLGPTYTPVSSSPTPPVPCGWVDSGYARDSGRFNDISAIPGGGIWTVGQNTAPSPAQPFWLDMTSNTSFTTFVPAGGELLGVDGVAPNDLWAVGYQGTVGSEQALAQHWDGTSVSTIPVPSFGARHSLNDVAALSATDVWFAGWVRDTNFSSPATLILHWNGSAWTRVPSPAPGGQSELEGITALAPNNIWAVGYYSSGSRNVTLVEHWDGATWSMVPSPNLGGPSEDNYLRGSTALSANDIWAVGTYNLFNGTSYVFYTLTQHWDGSAWSVVPSSNIPGMAAGNFLYDVSATGPNDVWAVGFAENGGVATDQPLALHWNGAQWLIDPTSNLGTGAAFYGVAALGANNVWAVGAQGTTTLVEHYLGPCLPSPTPVPPSPTPTPPVPCGWVVAAVGLLGNYLYDITAVAANDIWAGGADYFGGTLLVHWNGSAWSQEPSPSNGFTEIRGLAATAGNDVWAVGISNTGGPQLPYILHWDGSTWSVVPSPAPPGSLLFDVVAVAANDAWAVGQAGSNALALHWNGVSWSPVALPALGSPSSLHAITALGPNNIWAVGVVYSGNLPRTLVEHWDGVSWSVVPSPNTADPNDEDTLSGVAALTASDIWAVGYYYEAVSGTTKTLTEHWNGVSWTLVPGPNLPAGVDGYPADVAVLSPSDAWAVGWSYDGVQHQTLALHWDGVQWTINPTPNPPGAASLEALVVLGANDILAVGGGGVGIGAFLEHYLGPCAPSPTPTP